jgi:hypothetical protein
MKIFVPVCIICDAEDVRLWTLDNGEAAAVTYVCTEHEAPLMAIVEASQGLPLEFQVSLASRKTAGKQYVPTFQNPRERRDRVMRPLEWAPPESPQQVSASEPVAGVDVPVQLPEDAPEVGAGSDGQDMLTFSHGDVNSPGLQPLEVDEAPKRVKGKQRGRKQGSAGADKVVVHDVEVA